MMILTKCQVDKQHWYESMKCRYEGDSHPEKSVLFCAYREKKTQDGWDTEDLGFEV